MLPPSANVSAAVGLIEAAPSYHPLASPFPSSLGLTLPTIPWPHPSHHPLQVGIIEAAVATRQFGSAIPDLAVALGFPEAAVGIMSAMQEKDFVGAGTGLVSLGIVAAGGVQGLVGAALGGDEGEPNPELDAALASIDAALTATPLEPLAVLEALCAAVGVPFAMVEVLLAVINGGAVSDAAVGLARILLDALSGWIAGKLRTSSNCVPIACGSRADRVRLAG